MKLPELVVAGKRQEDVKSQRSKLVTAIWIA